MNKRINNNGITCIAREYAELLHDEGFQYYTPKHLFDTMVSKLADMFENDNERFDRDRFFKVIYHAQEE